MKQRRPGWGSRSRASRGRQDSSLPCRSSKSQGPARTAVAADRPRAAVRASGPAVALWESSDSALTPPPPTPGVQRRRSFGAPAGTLPGVIARAGGLPIKAGDGIVGGAAVSGSAGGNDEICVQAGIEKAKDLLK
ncbi:MAG: heme-binding protein [Bradyrhizobiaceae bacterium]|nr:heme-binding protein [Bradyrhizobiaceae bacterium]